MSELALAPLLAPPLPAGFRTYTLERTWTLRKPREVVWAWLNDPRTFTRGQIPPWRVEFLPLEDGRPGDFEPGCLNVHHGPLMSFHGMIGEVRAPEYRDLRYAYGSYALSLRLVRPTRLQFWFEDAGEGRTLLRLRLDCQVKRWFAPLWDAMNRVFWWNFGLSARMVLAFRT